MEQAYQKLVRLRSHVREHGSDLTGTEFEGDEICQEIAKDFAFKLTVVRAKNEAIA